MSSAAIGGANSCFDKAMLLRTCFSSPEVRRSSSDRARMVVASCFSVPRMGLFSQRRPCSTTPITATRLPSRISRLGSSREVRCGGGSKRTPPSRSRGLSTLPARSAMLEHVQRSYPSRLSRSVSMRGYFRTGGLQQRESGNASPRRSARRQKPFTGKLRGAGVEAKQAYRRGDCELDECPWNRDVRCLWQSGRGYRASTNWPMSGRAPVPKRSPWRQADSHKNYDAVTERISSIVGTNAGI